MAKKCTFELADITKIKLDVTNPRIAKLIEMHGDHPTPEQIHFALGVNSSEEESDGGTTYHSLLESIKTHGGIIHPIIVNRENDGTLTVIEGNTRAAIFQKFLTEGRVKGEWDKIPAMIYDNLSKIEIDSIRLQAHLVGPRAWDPYSKAKYLSLLRNEENLPMAQLVDYCGGKKTEVKEYLAAYEDMEKFYRDVVEDDSSFDTTRFSSFVEIQKSGRKQALHDHGFTMIDFALWVHERKLDPQQMVRKLHLILENEDATKVFLSKGAKEALKKIETPSVEPELEKIPLYQLTKALIVKINRIDYEEIQRLKKNVAGAEVQTIIDARELLDLFVNDLQEDEE